MIDFATLHQRIADFLSNNQFASGGLTVGLTGFAIAALRNTPGRLYHWLLDRVTTEIEITSKDELFKAIEFWSERKASFGRHRMFRAKVLYDPPNLTRGGYPDGPPTNETDRAFVCMAPGSGTHWFWHAGRPFSLHRKFIENKNDRYGEPVEQITATLFTRSRARAIELLTEAVDACLPDDQKTVRIYTADGSSWETCSVILARPPESVVLCDKTFESLVEDVRRFFARRDWYARVGVPYRRGYLFTGPPGNGKTTTILTLAGIFEAPVCIVDLSSPFLTDDKLRGLMSRAPAGAFILFEDIDAMCAPGIPFVPRHLPKPDDDDDDDGARKVRPGMGVSFSGLLNALDGVATPSGRVVFMSTNHPEKLDKALIRPGRVDWRVEFGNATHDQAARMFVRFFEAAQDCDLDRMANEFASILVDGHTSMATVQGVLIESNENPTAAIDLARVAKSV